MRRIDDHNQRYIRSLRERGFTPAVIYFRCCERAAWRGPRPTLNEIMIVIEHASSVRGGQGVRAGAVASAAVQSRPDMEGER